MVKVALSYVKTSLNLLAKSYTEQQKVQHNI